VDAKEIRASVQYLEKAERKWISSDEWDQRPTGVEADIIAQLKAAYVRKPKKTRMRSR